MTTPNKDRAVIAKAKGKVELPDIVKFGYATIGIDETDKIAADVLNKAFATGKQKGDRK